MSLTVALMLVLFAPPANASVPCTDPVGARTEPCLPSPAEQAEIVELLRKAEADFERFSEARDREKRFRGHLGLNDSGSLVQWKRAYDEVELPTRPALDRAPS